MATAREGANPYDGGLGAGGKFQKRPVRRAQATPYDRPQTVLRNPTHNNRNNGWLSKLVDPAQRLITSSAHRLFGSVFRKQLPPPPPPQPPESETHAKAKDEDHETNSPLPVQNPSVVKEGDSNMRDNPSNSSIGDGFTELEQILRQKTFTRSEIDRLTSLLHSRTVDASNGNEEKIPEAIPLKSLAPNERKEELPNTPIRENGTQGHLISTPFVSSRVLDEDIASPAELAKAYMGSRPSKLSPSMIGLRSQAEASNTLGNRIPPKTPIMSLVPRSSSHVQASENGIITPRYRGRSALYNMARTPYSRDGLTATAKVARLTGEFFGGPSSSSQRAWEQNGVSGSKQGTLKRRSSVLENDIGSVGPIRRIRQKSSLLSSKHLGLAASGSPPFVDAIGIDSNAEHPSLSTKKLLIAGEVKHSFAKTSMDNAESSIHSTGFTPVLPKSSEMATKILQQLDKLVSPRDKSPYKLSPSMLRGPALRSLENVDSSKFLGNLQGDVSSSGPPDILPSDTHELTSQKQNVEENAQKIFFNSNDEKSRSILNGADITGFTRAIVPSVMATGSLVGQSSQNKRAFRMSALEDYVELDDDDYSNKAVYAPLTVSPLVEIKPEASSTLSNKVENDASDQNLNVGKSTEIFSLPASSVIVVHQAMVVTESPPVFGTSASERELSSPAISSLGEKISSLRDPKVTSSSFSKNIDEAPQFTNAPASSVSEPLGAKFGVSSDSRRAKASSIVADSLTRAPESNKTVDNDVSKEGSISAAISASMTGSIFSFGSSTNTSGLNNGSLPTQSLFSTFSPLVSSNGPNETNLNSSSHSLTTSSNSATVTLATSNSINTSNACSLPFTASVSSFSSAPTNFKFGAPMTSASTVSMDSVLDSESKTKEKSFGNPTSVPSVVTTETSKLASTSSITASPLSSPFSVASPVISSTESSTFGVTSSAIGSNGSNIFGGTSSTMMGMGSSKFDAPSSSVASTGSNIFVGTSSTMASTGSGIFGGTSSIMASTGSNIFGGTTSTMVSTGTSIFGSTSPSTGGSIFGFSASAISTTAKQLQGSNPFMANNVQTSAVATGGAVSTQSLPIQFGSSASSPSFGLAGNTAFSSGGSLFPASATGSKAFSSVATFGLSSSSSVANSSSSTNSTASGIFGSSWQSPESSIFGSTFNSSSSTGFSYGAPSVSAAASNGAAVFFGSSTGAPSSSVFAFSSPAAATSTQPNFGNTPGFAFSSGPTSNNEQMNMEDSMAEDTVQATTSPTQAFGQPTILPPHSGFVFGASGAIPPFQFVSQQNIPAPQNPSPFQASGSLEFNAGGSFSLGTGGGDKSTRKYVKVKHKQRKK